MVCQKWYHTIRNWLFEMVISKSHSSYLSNYNKDLQAIWKEEYLASWINRLCMIVYLICNYLNNKNGIIILSGLLKVLNRSNSQCKISLREKKTFLTHFSFYNYYFILFVCLAVRAFIAMWAFFLVLVIRGYSGRGMWASLLWLRRAS